jgi:hypothetical protein
LNFSFVNLVFIFRCSSSTTNPVCEGRVNLLVCSLPLHRHSYIGFILTFVSSIHNKLEPLLKNSKYGKSRPCVRKDPLGDNTVYLSDNTFVEDILYESLVPTHSLFRRNLQCCPCVQIIH